MNEILQTIQLCKRFGKTVVLDQMELKMPSRVVSYSPFPADLSVDPLYEFFSPRLKTIFEARVDTLEPVAYLEQKFEIKHVRLHDFEASSPLAAMK